MKIEILQLLDGAKRAKGLTVIIDVLRAFSVACYVKNGGAENIVPIGDIDLAYKLKAENHDYILIGERFEQKPEGFDFGNSPSQVLDFDFTDKTVIHTTSSGTQGIVNATGADEIITGSFVNAQAIVNYIKKQNPEHVSLCCMGYALQYPTEEDTFCAEYIKKELEGKDNNFQQMREIIKNTSGQRFFDPEKEAFSPPIDFEWCMNLNAFNFVLKVADWKDGMKCLKAVCC